jgi:hypothetical protein
VWDDRRSLNPSVSWWSQQESNRFKRVRGVRTRSEKQTGKSVSAELAVRFGSLTAAIDGNRLATARAFVESHAAQRVSRRRATPSHPLGAEVPPFVGMATL